MRLTRNKADADDLLQSTCLRAIEKAHYFEEGSNLFGWTSKIMFNIFVSGYRRRKKFETQMDPEIHLERASVAPMQDVKMQLSDVRKAMGKLSPDHREILILICVQEMSYKKVANVLQIPIGTVRSRLRRARERLQTLMESPGYATEKLVLDGPVNENLKIIKSRSSYETRSSL